MALPFDPGTPFPVFPGGAEQGLALFTNVCATTRCTLLHLRAAELRDDGDAGRATAVGGEELSFELDVGTGQFDAADERARAWLASERGAWLASWIEDNATLLRGRFERLKGQAANEPADARPAPDWKPTVCIRHRQLFRRLFDAGVKLHAARVALEAARWSWIHVEVRGAFARQAWARVDDDPSSIELFASTDDETPWLVLAVTPLEEVSLESRGAPRSSCRPRRRRNHRTRSARPRRCTGRGARGR